MRPFLGKNSFLPLDKLKDCFIITVLYNGAIWRLDMEEKSTATLEKIQQAAMEEFAEKGFLGASLRQIVKHAGVTTGAFYGYFSSKEALLPRLWSPTPPR